MVCRMAEMEAAYRERVQTAADANGGLHAVSMLALGVDLFREIKLAELPDDADAECDMLLFQYGTWNWGDEFGKHFCLDITRQFMFPAEGEPYQLSLHLIFEPEAFRFLGSGNCWSDGFPDLESFAAHCTGTKGFRRAVQETPKTFRLRLEQC